MSEPKNQSALSFEESIQELQTIVEKMENGDLPLEQSLAYFEQGIKLVRESQNHLQNAEQKVKILMQESQQLADFQQSQEPESE